MLARIHILTLKRFTRLLTLALLIQMFISGEPAQSQKAAKQKSAAKAEVSKACIQR